MKKSLILLVICASFSSLNGLIVHANQFTDDKSSVVTNQAVLDVVTIKNGRALVSLRSVAEKLSLNVQYVPEYKQVVVYDEGTTIIFRIGYRTYTVNGIEFRALVAPIVHNEQAVLPARVIAEAFGLNISYDPQAQQVSFEVKREYDVP